MPVDNARIKSVEIQSASPRQAARFNMAGHGRQNQRGGRTIAQEDKRPLIRHAGQRPEQVLIVAKRKDAAVIRVKNVDARRAEREETLDVRRNGETARPQSSAARGTVPADPDFEGRS